MKLMLAVCLLLAVQVVLSMPSSDLEEWLRKRLLAISESKNVHEESKRAEEELEHLNEMRDYLDELAVELKRCGAAGPMDQRCPTELVKKIYEDVKRTKRGCVPQHPCDSDPSGEFDF